MDSLLRELLGFTPDLIQSHENLKSLTEFIIGSSDLSTDLGDVEKLPLEHVGPNSGTFFFDSVIEALGQTDVNKCLQFLRAIPTFQGISGKGSFFEAGIGAGKTTLGTLVLLLAAHCNKKMVFIEEPSNSERLQKFIANMKVEGEALNFQKLMMEYRCSILEVAVELKRLGFNVLLDRTLYGDGVFAYVNMLQGNMTEEEYAEYVDCHKRAIALYQELCETATVFYFPQGLEESKLRIAKRARPGEVSEGKISGYRDEYLMQINETYAKYFISFSLFPF
jgi:deoxyadenosine/deoxycytidine kinase